MQEAIKQIEEYESDDEENEESDIFGKFEI